DISDSQAHAASSDHAAPAPATLLSMLALLAMGVLCLPGQREALAQADKPAAGLDLQHARAQFVEAKGKKVFYAKRWDLSDLPSYGPKQKVSGTIRMWGSNYIVDGNVGKYWEEDRKSTRLNSSHRTISYAVFCLKKKKKKKKKQ